MNSFFDNVKFEVFSATKATKAKIPVLSSVALASDLIGHLQEVDTTPESETRGLAEKDRFIRYRLMVKASNSLTKILKTGVLIKLTHYKHPRLHQWVAIDSAFDEDTQYIVQSRNNIHTDGEYLNLGLIAKDQE